MKPGLRTPSTFLPERHLHLLDERADPYHDYSAVEGEAQCLVCGAVLRDGRWQWVEPSIDAASIRCPACRKEQEHTPAAYVEIEGAFLQEWKEEMIAAVREMEHIEKSQDPMQRIMSIETSDKGLMMTTTDVRLARAIAQILQSSYRCELDFHYDRDRSLLWLRCRAG